MKNIKKLIGLLLMCSIVMTSEISVEAANVELNGESSTGVTISAEIPQYFEVRIPKELSMQSSEINGIRVLQGMLGIDISGNLELDKFISVVPTDRVIKLTDESSKLSISGMILDEIGCTSITGMSLHKAGGNVKIPLGITCSSFYSEITPGDYTSSIDFDISVGQIESSIKKSSIDKTFSEEMVIYEDINNNGIKIGEILGTYVQELGTCMNFYMSCDNSSTETIFNIPEGVTIVGDCSKVNRNVSSINIAETVSGLGEYSLSGFTNITSLDIPEQCCMIAEGCLSGNTKLEKLTINSDMVVLDVSFVDGCTSLKEIEFTNAKVITNSGSNTEASIACDSLETITLPDCIEAIWLSENAFKNANISKVNYMGTTYTTNESLRNAMEQNGAILATDIFY